MADQLTIDARPRNSCGLRPGRYTLTGGTLLIEAGMSIGAAMDRRLSEGGATFTPAAADAQPAAEPTCEHCGGTGEVLAHAENCHDDLCALNGDAHSCAGRVDPCSCAAQAAAEPAWWRKRADEIELQVAQGQSDAMRCYTDMRALLQAAAQPARAGGDDLRECMTGDSNYAAGMLLGWNLCVAGEEAAFHRLRESRMRDAAQACAALAAAPQPAASTVPARWVSERYGGEFDGMTAGQGYRKGWNDCRDAMLAAAPAAVERQARPRLKVRLTSYPETNGKRNWTAMIVRGEPWDGLIGNDGGITVSRGEFWNRVAYHAERARFLLGERDTEPHILDYGDDVMTPDEWKGEGRHPIKAAKAGGDQA